MDVSSKLGRVLRLSLGLRNSVSLRDGARLRVSFRRPNLNLFFSLSMTMQPHFSNPPSEVGISCCPKSLPCNYGYRPKLVSAGSDRISSSPALGTWEGGSETVTQYSVLDTCVEFLPHAGRADGVTEDLGRSQPPLVDAYACRNDPWSST